MKRPPFALLAAAAFLFSAAGASGTVSLIFGNSTMHASNWANAADVGGQQLLWGIVVDAAGNGFHSGPGGYSPTGVSFATAGSFQSLRAWETGELTDDLLFLAPVVMQLVPNTNDSGVVGQNRITGIASIPIGGNVTTGDAFAIVWFNRTTFTGDAFVTEPFGMFMNPALTLPPDGATQPYSSVFAGPDPLKTMTNQFGFPEPSTMMLSLLGALGLMRRRR